MDWFEIAVYVWVVILLMGTVILYSILLSGGNASNSEYEEEFKARVNAYNVKSKTIQREPWDK